MGFRVDAAITPKAAAKLLISGEIDVSGAWQNNAARSVLVELLALSIDDFLQIVDGSDYGNIADIKGIPQFGKVDGIIKVPYFFVKTGKTCADYPQLGFFLKADVNATLVANTKFGENHGKAAAILGLASCMESRIMSSALTISFCSLTSEEQEEIVCRLLFRIPVVQIILKAAAKGKVNGYAPMVQLKESTMHRRGQCLRAIFRLLKKYDHGELRTRIDNICWIND